MPRSTIFPILLLSFIVGCANAEQSGSATAADSDQAITSFSLTSVSSLFRSDLQLAASERSYNAASLEIGQLFGFFDTRAASTNLKTLMNVKADGTFRKQKYRDKSGKETEDVEVERFKRASKRHGLVRIKKRKFAPPTAGDSPSPAPTLDDSAPSVGVVDLESGTTTSIDGMFYDIDNTVAKQGYLFGFDSSLKKLQRYEIATNQLTTYIELGATQTFMTGSRLCVSNTAIWWDDSGTTSDTSGNFSPMIIDENLNVIAQVMDSSSGLSPYKIILSTGQSYTVADEAAISVGGNGSQPNSGVFLAYSTDGKLLRLHTQSGFYTHLWGGSPTPDNVDITVSALTFGSGGITATQLFHAHPLTGLVPTADVNFIRCRTEETIASDSRKIPFGLGVVSANLSDSTNISVSYSAVSESLAPHLNTGGNTPSLNCIIRSNYVYTLNGAANAILRIDLDQAAVTPVTVVSDSSISSFFIAGPQLIYSSGTQTFSVDLATFTKSPLDTTKAVSVNDIVSLQ